MLVSSVGSYAVIFAGLALSQGAQHDYLHKYVETLTPMDYLLTVVVRVLTTVAAILLFRLRRAAFPWFIAALLCSLAAVGYRIAAKGWAATTGNGHNLPAILASWTICTGVIVYSYVLTKRGVLR
jgi:hypothetical protein